MTTIGWTRRLLVMSLGTVLITGCAVGLSAKDETPGQHFDRMMKEFAENCAKTKLKPNDRSCDRLKLKPADPLATEEGRFAHSIKIPNPVPEDSGYKPGMTPEQYFDHLCKTEAGEFIYKTVENVEGIYQMRPRESAKNDYLLEHLYAMEDPYGLAVGVRDTPEDYFVQPGIGKYQFLEIALSGGSKTSDGAKYRRYFRGSEQDSSKEFVFMEGSHSERVPYVVQQGNSSELRSRYGYTWRGIKRPHDREQGIAGGEIIILDLQTNEVLAVRRGFVRTGFVRNMTGVWWLTASKCSKEALKTDAQFIGQVLKPALKLQERKNDAK